MKKYFPSLSALFIVSLLLSSNSFAQNNLAAGDIAIVSYQSDTDPTNTFSTSVLDFDDRFSIVVLKPGGLAAGTVIYITDRGWNAVSNNWLDEAYPPFTFGIGSEAVIKWVVPAGGIIQGKEVFFIGKYHDELPAGSEYYQWFAYSDESGTTPLGTITNETPIVPTSIPPPNGFTDGMSLFSAGDNILIFQTGPPAGAPTNYDDATRRFITAILANIRPTDVGTPTSYASWDVAPNVQNESSIPPGLVNGQTCFLMSPGPLPHPTAPVPGTVEPDNGKFSNCALSSAGACTALQMAAIIYNIANWTYSNSVFPVGTSSSKCTYTLSLPTPTITPGSATTFCTGGSVVLSSNSASGNQWYVGGNPIGGATNQTYTANANGTYTVVVTSNGCSSSPSLGTVVTVNPTPSTPTITPGSATTFCTGGSVVLSSSSASGNQWYVGGNPIGGETNQTYTANANGTYTVVVTSGGCSSSSSSGTLVTVNSTPSTPTITPGSATTFCTGGSVVLTSSSASGNQWYVGGNPIGAATNQTYTASTSGNYTVVATSGGCSSAFSLGTVVTVNIPTTSDTTAAVCNKFTWHDSTYKISTDAVWHTTNAGGCDSTRTLHLTILSVTSITSKTNATCNSTATGSIIVTPTFGVSPFTYRIGTVATYGASNTFNSLRAGSYRVSILDANGCAGVSDQVIITQPVAIAGTSVVTNATCYGVENGSITVTPTTGTAPHTYRLGNTGSFTSPNVFNNVKAGAYRLYIQDANSCIGSIVVTLTQPTKVSGTATKNDETCPGARNGSITVTGAGGTLPYTYRFGSTGAYTATNTFSNLKAGSYRVYVNDANGCSGFSILTTVGQTSGSCFTARTGLPVIEPSNSNLKVSISPNPSSHQFTLQVNSTRKESVQIRVMDVNGRTVHTIKGISEKMYRFGEQFAPGLYMIEVRQGEEAKTLKAVKN